MDGRLRRYVPLDVFVAFEQPGVTLKKKWGMEGVAAWALFLAACKREPIQGVFTYSTEDEGWAKLGAKAAGFSLGEFFNVTGRLKNTSRRRSGEVTYVSCTKWGLWNDAYGRQLEAEKKSRSRAQSRGDNPPTIPGRPPDDTGTDSELELEGEVESSSSATQASLKDLNLSFGETVDEFRARQLAIIAERDAAVAARRAREGAA